MIHSILFLLLVLLQIIFVLIMGGSHSCFPSPIGKYHTSRRHRRYEPTKIQQIQIGFDRPLHRNNNNRNPIDLNNASEEKFMELPGVTRSIAQDIIQYRDSHQGFKQIDELRNISSIDENLLTKIRSDLSFQSTIKTLVKPDVTNLNSATYDELCRVPGLTPLLVGRILQRRQQKGPFRFVEDLLKIKGIDYVVLAQLRSCVVVVDERSATIPPSLSESSLCQSSNHDQLYPTLNRSAHNTTIDSISMASLILETLPPELQTIFLSSSLHRPSPMSEKKERPFRFASWNLQQLTNEKVQNPGVREVICRTILEQNFSLIGIQEIGHKEALGYIVEELNHPTIPTIKDWTQRYQGKWTYIISDVAGRMFQGSEYLGFIYDESMGIECKKSSLLPLKTHFTRSPFIGVFRLNDKYEFVFVNVHLKARRLDEDENERTKDEALSLSILADAIRDTVEQKHVVIFGDFNLIPTASEFDALLQRNYSFVIQEKTNISLKNPQGSTCVDNIWLSAPVQELTTGNSGVIRENLTSMWIPAGWTWGGLVSDHCPIWFGLDLTR